MPLPSPLPDLGSLDLLRSVAQLGSIRQAARAHHVSQPAASTRIRTLERVVGLELLDRSGRGATLTPYGRAVVEWSGGILDSVEQLLAGIAALRAEGRSHLRVAASMTVAEYLIPRWLERLRATEPEVVVSLEMGNSERIAGLVAGREVDVGFVEGTSIPAGLEQRVVRRDELAVIAAPSHPWAARRNPITASQLVATPLVLREIGSGTREVFERALAHKGLATVPRVELGSTTAIKAAVALGTGPGVVSRLAVEGELAAGSLVVVPLADLDLSRVIRAIWARGRTLPSAARRLVAEAEVVPRRYAGQPAAPVTG